eukprot:gene59162-78944_t
MEAEELGAWLRLTQAPGIGGESVRRLLAAYGSPEHALAAGAGGWREQRYLLALGTTGMHLAGSLALTVLGIHSATFLLAGR